MQLCHLQKLPTSTLSRACRTPLCRIFHGRNSEHYGWLLAFLLTTWRFWGLCNSPIPRPSPTCVQYLSIPWRSCRTEWNELLTKVIELLAFTFRPVNLHPVEQSLLTHPFCQKQRLLVPCVTAATRDDGDFLGLLLDRCGTVASHIPSLQRAPDRACHHPSQYCGRAHVQCYATLNCSAHTCEYQRTMKSWILSIPRPLSHHKLVMCKPPPLSISLLCAASYM